MGLSLVYLADTFVNYYSYYMFRQERILRGDKAISPNLDHTIYIINIYFEGDFNIKYKCIQLPPSKKGVQIHPYAQVVY